MDGGIVSFAVFAVLAVLAASGAPAASGSRRVGSSCGITAVAVIGAGAATVGWSPITMVRSEALEELAVSANFAEFISARASASSSGSTVVTTSVASSSASVPRSPPISADSGPFSSGLSSSQPSPVSAIHNDLGLSACMAASPVRSAFAALPSSKGSIVPPSSERSLPSAGGNTTVCPSTIWSCASSQAAGFSASAAMVCSSCFGAHL